MLGAKQQQLQPRVSPEISGNNSHSLSARTRIFQTFRCISNTVDYPFLFLNVGMLGDWVTGNTGWGLETRCSTIRITQRRWVTVQSEGSGRTSEKHHDGKHRQSLLRSCLDHLMLARCREDFGRNVLRTDLAEHLPRRSLPVCHQDTYLGDDW